MIQNFYTKYKKNKIFIHQKHRYFYINSNIDTFPICLLLQHGKQ